MSTNISAAVKPPRRFPPPCWTQEEALGLIQAYRDRWYALRRGYLRTADWDAVAEDVGRICPGAIPPKTSAQCRHKMEKLRQRYRAEKQRAMSFPGGHFISTWFYFEAMDSMENNGEDSQSGMKNIKSESNYQSGLNSSRGIRFKPSAIDNTVVTVASRSNNFREENDNDEFEENDYYVGKNHKLLPSQNFAIRFQSDHQDIEQNVMARPRKFSKTGSNSSHSYLNENGENHDNDFDEDDVWVKMPKDKSSNHYIDGESEKRGVKRENDPIGEIVSSIKLLADGFVKTEKMKMDMVRDIEKMRMEAEMKRNEMLLESQKQIVEAFVKGLAENKKLR